VLYGTALRLTIAIARYYLQLGWRIKIIQMKNTKEKEIKYTLKAIYFFQKMKIKRKR
jgi:hypothetical protein